MSFAKPNDGGYRGGKVPEIDVTKCSAYGCKCRATTRVDGGTWACGAHAHANPDDWQSLTHKLNDNFWLVEFIDEMQKMDRRSQPWRQFAVQFWEGTDDHCKPHPQENALPYQYRLRGELLYRVGQLSKRPAIRLPQVVTPRGHFAERQAA